MKNLHLMLFVVLGLGVFGLALTLTASAEQRPAYPTDPLVQFSAQGHVLGFGVGELIVSNATYALRVRFVGANVVAPQSDTLAATNSKGASPLSRVTYANLWDGITLAYDTTHGIVSSNYSLAPNADTRAIHLRYNTPVTLNVDGTLSITYATGEMTESAPIAWQEIQGVQVPVAVAFAQTAQDEVAFKVGEYDAREPLFIDPTLSWNTFLGGSDYDMGKSIAVDASGNVYVAGENASSWGSPVRAYTSEDDVFAAKLDPSGNLIWNTFLGADGSDHCGGIAVDANGDVYVAGESPATWGSPILAHGDDPLDAFAAKLDASGNLTWNTFFGAPGFDLSRAIAVDRSGNLYVAGQSSATWGSPNRPFADDLDAFAVKLDTNGNLKWNTFLGGSGRDDGDAIAVDESENVYVAGEGVMTWGSPIRAHTDAGNAFAAKLDADGNLMWSTFLGAAGDIGTGIAVNGSGNVYVAGTSPKTWGAPIRTFTTGDLDAFAAKLDGSGNLIWNTFLGGDGLNNGSAIAVDSSGNSYVGGDGGPWGSPIRGYSSSGDAFAARLDGDGNLLWNTFLGGNGDDVGTAIALDRIGNVYMAGGSMDTWGAPVRSFTPYSMDVFVAKISNTPTAPLPISPRDGVILRKLKFTLDWACLACGEFYKLKIKDITVGKMFLSKTGIKDTQFRVKGLVPGHSYWWQLKACNAIGCTKGPRSHFTISKS